MSLFNMLSTGASGMGASSTNLSVIGDNIANIGTTAFKGSTATFGDNFPNVVQSSLNGIAQVGTGARLADVAMDFSQGSRNVTSSPIDVAILGQGFFQVASGDEMFYTRDGSFHLDVDNYVDIDASKWELGDVFVDVDQDQLSQEFQFLFDDGGRLNAVFGLYYLNESITSHQEAYADDFLTLGALPLDMAPDERAGGARRLIAAQVLLPVLA
jgi:flagellar hook-basal body protein